MAVMTPAELERYADAVVSTCLRLRRDDVLAVHGEAAHRDLIVALTERAYAKGVRHVDAMVVEPRIRRARIVGARDEDSLKWNPRWHRVRMRDLIAADASLVSITGEEDPGLMDGLDPRRAMLETTGRFPGREEYLKAVAARRARFCVVAYPAPGWARQVYPKLPVERALRALAKDLLSFCRIADQDAPDAWQRHVELLRRRAQQVNRKGFARMRFVAPGTDLTVGLDPGTRFVSADMKSVNGRTWCANLPTEEVFASPDYRVADGRFTCTRPLSLEGRMFDGIRAEFAGGRLTRIDARTTAQRDFLAAYFARDRGAGRLGEIALVDRASRIGQTGRVYHTTLLDENAVAHVALGSAYSATRVEDPSATGDRGLNRSRIHVDVMIGSDELDVHGITKAGKAVPVIEAGGWVL